MLTVPGGRAGCEPDLIRARTSEGRARQAAEREDRSPPREFTGRHKREAIKRGARKQTPGGITRSYNVSGWTISRLG